MNWIYVRCYVPKGADKAVNQIRGVFHSVLERWADPSATHTTVAVEEEESVGPPFFFHTYIEAPSEEAAYVAGFDQLEQNLRFKVQMKELRNRFGDFISCWNDYVIPATDRRPITIERSI